MTRTRAHPNESFTTANTSMTTQPTTQASVTANAESALSVLTSAVASLKQELEATMARKDELLGGGKKTKKSDAVKQAAKEAAGSAEDEAPEEVPDDEIPPEYQKEKPGKLRAGKKSETRVNAEDDFEEFTPAE